MDNGASDLDSNNGIRNRHCTHSSQLNSQKSILLMSLGFPCHLLLLAINDHARGAFCGLLLCGSCRWYKNRQRIRMADVWDPALIELYTFEHINFRKVLTMHKNTGQTGQTGLHLHCKRRTFEVLRNPMTQMCKRWGLTATKSNCPYASHNLPKFETFGDKFRMCT